MRASGSGSRIAATAPGSNMLCWLCTTPFGRPVVPLVYAIAAGANGSTPGRTGEDASASAAAHSDAGSPGSAATTVRSVGRSRRNPFTVPTAVSSPTNSDTAQSSRRYAISGGASALFTPTQMAPRRATPRHAITSSR